MCPTFGNFWWGIIGPYQKRDIFGYPSSSNISSRWVYSKNGVCHPLRSGVFWRSIYWRNGVCCPQRMGTFWRCELTGGMLHIFSQVRILCEWAFTRLSAWIENMSDPRSVCHECEFTQMNVEFYVYHVRVCFSVSSRVLDVVDTFEFAWNMSWLLQQASSGSAMGRQIIWNQHGRKSTTMLWNFWHRLMSIWMHQGRYRNDR